MRLDRGGEYYGRYMEKGEAPRPFEKFLQEHGIIAKHTIPGSPNQNGEVERKIELYWTWWGVCWVAKKFLDSCGLKHLRWQCIY